MQTSPDFLAADIGGTNARFALVDGHNGKLSQIQIYRCGDFAELFDVVDSYFKTIYPVTPQRAVLSLATSIDGDQLSMTNNSWRFSVGKLRQRLGLTSIKVINDFTALALALPDLSRDDYRKLGGGSRQVEQTMAVIGPGTGLGVSAIVKTGSGWWPLQGEGGHVSYGPLDRQEAEVIEILWGQFEHVSSERLLCGSGLLLLYQTLAKLKNHRVSANHPEEVTALALQQNCPVAGQALSMFCAMLGSVAGNLALTVGARGGVFLSGGILPQLGEYFAQSDFRKRFEMHGRFSAYLEKIPTYVMQSEYIALKGAALALAPEYNSLGFSSAD